MACALWTLIRQGNSTMFTTHCSVPSSFCAWHCTTLWAITMSREKRCTSSTPLSDATACALALRIEALRASCGRREGSRCELIFSPLRIPPVVVHNELFAVRIRFSLCIQSSDHTGSIRIFSGLRIGHARQPLIVRVLAFSCCITRGCSVSQMLYV